jgi:hypothetical protein
MNLKDDIDPATAALIEKTAEEAACRSMRKTLVMMGVNPNDMIEFQKDTAHLRAWRKRVERIEEKSKLTIVIAIIGMLGTAIWIGIKTKLGVGP